MEAAAKFAGFLAAHAVWSVSDGETLIPLMGTETPDGKRKMDRFMVDRIEQGVREGQDRLNRTSESATRAALVYDGFITLPTGKVDALLVDIREYGPPSRSLLMAVPYRPASSPQGFAVHRPKFLSSSGTDPDYQKVGSAFFEIFSNPNGVASFLRHTLMKPFQGFCHLLRRPRVARSSQPWAERFESLQDSPRAKISENIQHSTSNAQPSTAEHRVLIGRSMLNVPPFLCLITL